MRREQFRQYLQQLEEARAERELARREREQQRAIQAAQNQFNFMLSMARGDPQRAFQIFGQPFLQAARGAFGVELPTKEVPVTRQVPLTRIITQEQVNVTPRQAPPRGFVRMRDPKEGEPRWGVDVTTTERTIEEPTGEIVEEPTGEFRRVLALPEPEPEVSPELRALLATPIQLGGRTVSLGAVVQLATSDRSGQLMKLLDKLIVDPIEALNTQRVMFQMQLDSARLQWQMFTDRQRLRLRELELQANEAFRNARIAIDQGRLDEARRHNQVLERINEEMLQIRREVVRQTERRLDIQERAVEQPRATQDPVLNRLRREYNTASANVSALARAIRMTGPGGMIHWGNRVYTRDQAMELLKTLAAQRDALYEQLLKQTRYRVTYTHQGRQVTRELTSEQIIHLIRQLMNRGWSRSEIGTYLRAMGVPVERFGLP